MRIPPLLLLAGLLAFPHVSAAQFDDPRLPAARLTVTPLFGVRAAHDTRIQVGELTADGRTFTLTDEHRGAATLLGAQVELRAIGPLSVVAALAHSPSAQVDIERQDTEGNRITAIYQGPQLWFAKLGLGYRLPDPLPDARHFHPAASIVLAPAVVREDPEKRVGAAPEFAGPIDNFALNAGVQVALGLGSPHVALQLAVEDFYTFWNSGEQARRLAAQTQNETGAAVQVSASYARSHIIVPSVGISIRF